MEIIAKVGSLLKHFFLNTQDYPQIRSLITPRLETLRIGPFVHTYDILAVLEQSSTTILHEIEIIRYADGIQALHNLLNLIEYPLSSRGFKGLVKIKLTVVPNNPGFLSVIEAQRDLNADVGSLLQDLRNELDELWEDVSRKELQRWRRDSIWNHATITSTGLYGDICRFGLNLPPFSHHE